MSVPKVRQSATQRFFNVARSPDLAGFSAPKRKFSKSRTGWGVSRSLTGLRRSIPANREFFGDLRGNQAPRPVESPWRRRGKPGSAHPLVDVDLPALRLGPGNHSSKSRLCRLIDCRSLATAFRNSPKKLIEGAHSKAGNGTSTSFAPLSSSG